MGGRLVGLRHHAVCFDRRSERFGYLRHCRCGRNVRRRPEAQSNYEVSADLPAIRSECYLALCSVLSLAERSRYNWRPLAEHGDTIRFERRKAFVGRKRRARPIHAHFGQFLAEEAQIPYQQLACAHVSYRELRVIWRER